MKRTPMKRGTKPLKAKTPMRKVSGKRKAYRASQEGQDALDYMRAVKALPCVVCGSYGVDAHHPQSGRFGKTKASDFDVVPLCPKHHRHEYGPGAYHYSKREWEAAHGPDHGYIDQTREAVKAMRQ